MGWGRMLLLGDWGQQMDIGDLDREVRALRARVAAPKREIKDLRAHVEALDAEIGELRLYLAVLLKVVVAKGLVTKEQLERIVEAVDLADGQADGRYEGKPLA